MGYDLWLCRPRKPLVPGVEPAPEQLDDIGTGDEVLARLKTLYAEHDANWWQALRSQFGSFFYDGSDIRLDFEPGARMNKRVHLQIGCRTVDRTGFIQKLCDALDLTAYGQTTHAPLHWLVVTPVPRGF